MTLQSMMISCLSGALLLLAGCSSVSCGDNHPYQDARPRPPLAAPAGVTVPTPDPAYIVPGDSGAGGSRTDIDAAGRCTNAPPELVPAAGTAKPAVQAAPPAASATPVTAAPAPASRPTPVAAPPPME